MTKRTFVEPDLNNIINAKYASNTCSMDRSNESSFREYLKSLKIDRPLESLSKNEIDEILLLSYVMSLPYFCLSLL